MRNLDPGHIDSAFRNIDSGSRTISMRLKARIKDETEKDLFMALGLMMEGLKIFLEVVPHRIERLHQKIDRIEKKIGSV